MTDTMSQFSQNVDRTILEEVGGLSLEAEEPMNQFSFNLLKRGGYSPWENVYGNIPNNICHQPRQACQSRPCKFN